MIQVQTFQMPGAATAVAIREERSSDAPAREALLDAAFGPGREERTCQRLRTGRVPAQGLAFTATLRGRLVGTVRLWPIDAGGRPALLLGPLAVDATARDRGVGAALMRHAVAKAAAKGHRAIVLLGDAPYYARFGFSTEKTAALVLAGPYAPERLLGLELTEGALDGAHGMVLPTGAKIPGTRARRPRAARIPTEAGTAPRAA